MTHQGVIKKYPVLVTHQGVINKYPVLVTHQGVNDQQISCTYDSSLSYRVIKPSSSISQRFLFLLSLNSRRSSKVQGRVRSEHCNKCVVFSVASPHTHVVSPSQKFNVSCIMYHDSSRGYQQISCTCDSSRGYQQIPCTCDSSRGYKQMSLTGELLFL